MLCVVSCVKMIHRFTVVFNQCTNCTRVPGTVLVCTKYDEIRVCIFCFYVNQGSFSKFCENEKKPRNKEGLLMRFENSFILKNVLSCASQK